MLPFLPLHILSLAGLAWLRMIPPVRAFTGDSRCGPFMCVNATIHGDMITCKCRAWNQAAYNFIFDVTFRRDGWS